MMAKPILDLIPVLSSGDGKEADKGCNPYSPAYALTGQPAQNTTDMPPDMLMKPQRRDHLSAHMIVWLAHVSKAQDVLASFDSCLDQRDRERAARFKFPADRARFTLGRAMVRKCLGHYLEQPAETVELAYTDLGRPFFPADKKLQFSISHTQDLVGVAVTEGAQIGIDLEAISPHLDLIELAERIFSPDDLAIFQAYSAREKVAAFYRAWTRKEAYLKARGEGIAEGLQEISVSMAPEEVLSIRDNRHASASGKWHLISLPLPGGYAGTLACDDVAKHLEGSFITFPNAEPTPESAWCFRSQIARPRSS
jgi:4'-phosphopantetheinyl transferase